MVQGAGYKVQGETMRRRGDAEKRRDGDIKVGSQHSARS